MATDSWSSLDSYSWTDAYKSSGAGTRMGRDSFVDATLKTPEDTVVLTHEYQMLSQ